MPIYIWMKVQRKEYGETAVVPVDYHFASSNGAMAGANGKGNDINGNGIAPLAGSHAATDVGRQS